MKDISKERRKYQRYDLETKVHFYVKDFNLVTKVKFRKLNNKKDAPMAKEFVGISRNVSVEGIRFCSLKKLKAEESLFIKVYLPKSSRPIPMVGEVRWSKKVISAKDKRFKYDTGVRLLTVKGKSVARSIHIDSRYNEPWSIVLESVFGSFHKILHKAMKKVKRPSPGAIFKAMEES